MLWFLQLSDGPSAAADTSADQHSGTMLFPIGCEGLTMQQPMDLDAVFLQPIDNFWKLLSSSPSWRLQCEAGMRFFRNPQCRSQIRFGRPQQRAGEIRCQQFDDVTLAVA